MPTMKVENDEWEDIPEDEHQASVPPIPGVAVARGISARRRKTASKTVYAAPPTPRRSTTSRVQREATPIVDREQLQQAVISGASYTTVYMLDVVSTAFRLLRKPLGVLLFFYLLAFLFSKLNSAFRTVVAPFCIIPGISRSPLCLDPPSPLHTDQQPKWANYTKLMDIQSATFGQLLEESVGGSGLSIEVKQAEMATSDLITLVRVSDLTSRELLAQTLGDFVQDARKTGRGLHTLSAKIGGAVDNIMAINDYALHSIEAAQSKSSVLSIWPFKSSVTKEVVLQTFNEAMSVLSAQLYRLILEAEVEIASLEKLEEYLNTIHDILTREDVSISAEKEELLSALWTKLGGNRRALRGHDHHLQLLRNLGAYRKRALAHVVAALQAMQSLSAEVEDLRERVAAPEILGDNIPIEVHLNSIKGGMERLREGRTKAKEREAQLVRRILPGIEGAN
ncbi:hypothetical protein AcW1_008030 [Taiwanofungus camphoratus]|nr:hypothetical protein AcW1_008030 [Antrodia cinnamomea]KAI0955745.1 hypothetical protein AcV7_006324 [Antrodia cinnamomea]